MQPSSHRINSIVGLYVTFSGFLYGIWIHIGALDTIQQPGGVTVHKVSGFQRHVSNKLTLDQRTFWYEHLQRIFRI